MTGIGLCFPIIIIVSAFSSLFGTGGAPRAAIAMGQGDDDYAENVLGNCFVCLVLIAITLSLILHTFGQDLLYIFGASDTTIVYAWNYLSIYSMGTIFVQLAVGLNMFITTQGFTKISMATVLIGAGLNIILDPIFIFVLGMNVQGAALATIISQAVSAIWVMKFLTGKKTKLKIKKKYMKLDPKIVLAVVSLGISPFIMASTESLLIICFNISLAKYGGDIAVGAMTILSSVMQMCSLPLSGMMQGTQPIISFNYGAKNYDRVREAVKLARNCAVIYTVAMFIIVQSFPTVIIGLFNSDPDLVELTT